MCVVCGVCMCMCMCVYIYVCDASVCVCECVCDARVILMRVNALYVLYCGSQVKLFETMYLRLCVFMSGAGEAYGHTHDQRA